MNEPVAEASEADLRFGLVRRRYGDRLTSEQLDALRKAVHALVEQVGALRAVRLTNDVEPLQRFVPFRGDE
jgi:hypothetical protein